MPERTFLPCMALVIPQVYLYILVDLADHPDGAG